MDYCQIKQTVIKSIGLLMMTVTIQANANFSIFTSNSTSVIVQEDFNGSLGQLTVTNSSAQPVYAFAVGNNDAFQAFGWKADRNRLDALIPDGEKNNRWGASVISRTGWESGNIGSNGNSFGLNANNAWTVPDTTTLSWDDLFGSEFTRIVSYWVVGENTPLLLDDPNALSSPISSGSTQSHFFFFSRNAFSPFVAFGNDGTVIARGETTVPIPATVWLLGTALLALAVFKPKPIVQSANL